MMKYFLWVIGFFGLFFKSQEVYTICNISVAVCVGIVNINTYQVSVSTEFTIPHPLYSAKKG